MSLRKALKTRVAFPSENAALKVMYLSLRNLIAKWERPLKWKAVPEPVHPALGRSDTDRDQSVILVTHFAPDRNRCGWRGPPSRLSDELAPFGNDGGPRQPNNSNYPGHKGNKQNELAPTTEALTRGTAFTQNRGHSPCACQSNIPADSTQRLFGHRRGERPCGG
jgi:hypothetical protein